MDLKVQLEDGLTFSYVMFSLHWHDISLFHSFMNFLKKYLIMSPFPFYITRHYYICIPKVDSNIVLIKMVTRVWGIKRIRNAIIKLH